MSKQQVTEPKTTNINATKRDPLMDFGIAVGRVPLNGMESRKWEITFLKRLPDGKIDASERFILSKSSAIGMIGVLAERIVKGITWPNGGQQ